MRKPSQKLSRKHNSFKIFKAEKEIYTLKQKIAHLQDLKQEFLTHFKAFLENQINILDNFSKDKKIDLKSYSMILSSLVSANKITKQDIRKSLNDLLKSGSLSEKDYSTITNSLDIKPEYYIASKTGTKFHRKDCISLKKIPRKNQVIIKTREEAKSKGFVQCNVCKP